MKWFEVAATGLGSGFLPKAPGTWGTFLGLPLGWFVGQSSLVLGSIILIISHVFAYWTIAKTEEKWQTHDDGRIVIDEIVGFGVVYLFVPFTIITAIIGFTLFRLFDILKPGPVGWADRELPGAMGTLLDDSIAGLLAGLALLIVHMLVGFS